MHLHYRPKYLTRANYSCGPSTYQPTYQVAPHTGAHVDPCGGVASCHVAAPLCASYAPCGPPGLCHVASVPRRTFEVVPCATSAPSAPARHVITCGKFTPLFRDLNKRNSPKNHFKNQIKFKKRHKFQKFII